MSDEHPFLFICDSSEELTLVMLADKSAKKVFLNSTLVVWTITPHIEDY